MLHIAAICVGASLGALARWQLGLWLNVAGQLPWGTLAANAIGGYCIGAVLAVLQALPELNPVWRLAIVTGFLGALTTFSTFSAEVVSLLQAQRWLTALAWAAAHLLISLALTVAGMYSVQWLR
ncbi:MAG: fluoride efflux transporter CrcB [Comamonas sp.]|nr:fluoride efflux transporter CrcB [Candidatus Comamonas equi]